MTEDEFWAIVGRAEDDDDFQATLDGLAARLARLTDDELLTFIRRYDAVVGPTPGTCGPPAISSRVG